MSTQRTRREMLAATVAVLTSACARAQPASTPSNDVALVSPRAIEDIEARLGGRVGVFAIDTGIAPATSDTRLRRSSVIAHRADERFAMCSTFKWVLAAAVLARVDRGELILTERIAYGPADLLEHAPLTRARVQDGAMTLDELASASVIVSDNTAANLLLAKLGGPSAITRFARSLGDEVTRLDRNEPALNASEPGDPRDTTSPRAMVGLMERVLCGDALLSASRDRLLGWMRACETGKRRLRAGFPKDWIVGDKTGSGPRSAVNDVAIAFPPGRAPILVAAYMTDAHADTEALAAAHADVARCVARLGQTKAARSQRS